MLSLTRRVGESILLIGRRSRVRVELAKAQVGQARLAFDAPSDVQIHRLEIYEESVPPVALRAEQCEAVRAAHTRQQAYASGVATIRASLCHRGCRHPSLAVDIIAREMIDLPHTPEFVDAFVGRLARRRPELF